MVKPSGPDRMHAAFVSLLLTVGYLALADKVFEGRQVFGHPLKRPGVLPVLGLVSPVAPAALAVSATSTIMVESGRSRATRARIVTLFRDLAAGRRHRIRIAYLGDSIIEGDLITEDLRIELQKQYGGQGVGFVDLASPFADLRPSVRETAGPGWRHWQVGGGAPAPPASPGLGGTLAMAPAGGKTGRVRFLPGAGSRKGVLPPASLLYGRIPSGGSAAVVSVHSLPAGAWSVTLTGGNAVNRLPLSTTTTAGILFAFSGAADVPLYGVDFEMGDGVYVDNYAMRGCSGTELSSVPPEVIRGFQDALAYDIVILHFGINVEYRRPEDYHLYARAFRRAVDHLAAALPGAAFVVVSAPDRGFKSEAGIVTLPHLPYILDAQRTVAAGCGAAFFNLFGAMGGQGSMARWVVATPPMAWKDYTHPNNLGSRVIAEMLKAYLTGEEAHRVP